MQKKNINIKIKIVTIFFVSEGNNVASNKTYTNKLKKYIKATNSFFILLNECNTFRKLGKKILYEKFYKKTIRITKNIKIRYLFFSLRKYILDSCKFLKISCYVRPSVFLSVSRGRIAFERSNRGVWNLVKLFVFY